MLKKKWPRRVVSDEGFEVQIESRGTIIYKEGKKTLIVNSEYLVGEVDIAIYQSSIKRWESPFDKELIDHAKQKKILDNIKEALAFRKTSFEIV